MSEKKMNVLFLCTGNSSRSVMAEAILNDISVNKGRFQAYSAGSRPTGKINPYALEQLERNHLSSAGLRSKSWDEFSGPDAPAMDFVFTVCDSAAEESCPVWPGQPMTAHWGIPDPAAETGSEMDTRRAFVAAFKQLQNRILLLAALPFEALDRDALQTKLESIGRSA
jgi:protein-tyrosine-phosphatase